MVDPIPIATHKKYSYASRMPTKALEDIKHIVTIEIAKGIPCDPTRHGALKGSMWATVYTQEYIKQLYLNNQNEGDP